MHKNRTINTALIGYGYWGKNLLRNISENPLTGEIFLLDTNIEKFEKAQSLYKTIKVIDSIDEICQNASIESVVVATPTEKHFEHTKKLLLAGKHVLVEKPITTSSTQAKELMEIAASNNLTLMVDHIFLYNPAVLKLRDLIADNIKFGNLTYIDSTRVNLGIYQQDTNVLWDLACHDVSIVNFLTKEKPDKVRAIGRLNSIHNIEDIVYIFLFYKSGLMVQINSSWASPVKMRKMIIGGNKQMIIYDDIEPTNKLVVYDYEVNTEVLNDKSKLTDYRLGNISIPKYLPEEALKNVIQAFYHSIITGTPPLANGSNALDVVTILECANESLMNNGTLIQIN
jgi:predicted dehydrogenase